MCSKKKVGDASTRLISRRHAPYSQGGKGEGCDLIDPQPINSKKKKKKKGEEWIIEWWGSC